MGVLDLFRLDGRCGFVTGAARGIGQSIAQGLTEAGAKVAIVDIDLDGAEITESKLVKLGYECFAIHVDVTQKKQVRDMVDKFVKRWGRLDFAVNNAGRCINAPAEQMTEQQWEAVIDLNLKGVFLCAQAAGKVMIRQRSGSIINIASMSAQIVNHPQPQVAYNASKAGVIQLTKSMAVEWAKYSVRVNSISPGYTRTDLLMGMKEFHSLWIEMTPMKRLGEPEEMKGAAVFLASDASSFVTGSDLVVDGGYTLW
jgi:NAD(P)-dependent dehydrogenase (short-subunit alcohol dehydrogenase family)